jgi:multiple sugar transport system substrate-binding protein
VTLRFAVYGDEQTVAAYQRLADAYTDEHPDVTVRVQHSPDRTTALQRLDRQFERGRAPDLFLLDHGDLPGYVAAQRVQPVDQLLEQRGVLFGDTYQRLGLEAFSADSALQCMPDDVSPLVVFYNKRLLRPRTLATPDQPAPSVEDGWTWEQFATAARRMSHGRVRGVYVAPELGSLIPLVRSAGADVMDDERQPTTLTMADDGTRDALEQVLALLRDRRVTPSRRLLARESPQQLFEAGRIGMMFGTRRLVPKLREAQGLRFDVLPLPSLGRSRTVAEMNGYCISAQSDQVQATADFLTFATGPQGSRITAGFGGLVPANLEALHSDDFLDPGAQPRHPLVFAEGLRHADALPFAPAWPQVEAQTGPLVAQLFYAPVLDLDRLLPRMDSRSRALLAPAEASPSPSP